MVIAEPRSASPADAEAIADLVNRAYQVEAFFVSGDRTSVAEVRRLMAVGRFLVIDRHGAAPGVTACVFTSVDGDRGYFGLLAVEPEVQRKGLGHALIERCEAEATRAGCRVMAIKVVDLRTDLLPRYERLGYVRVGDEPYVGRPVILPCHFVTMEKTLGER